MDHFALNTDGLVQSLLPKNVLHRNFMGYTDTQTALLVGLGTSAISDAWWGYAQNEKGVEAYYKRLKNDELPFFKGHILTEEDLVLRRHIQRLMCNFETTWHNENEKCKALYEAINRLEEMETDGLVEIKPYHLHVTPEGRNFVRNVCMAFDARLWEKVPETQVFSLTV